MSIVIKLCKGCGSEFKRHSVSRRNYCFQCRPEEIVKDEDKTITKICNICKKEYKTNKINRQFCDDCKNQKAEERKLSRYKYRNPYLKKCSGCGKFIEVNNKLARTIKCKDCKAKHNYLEYDNEQIFDCPNCNKRIRSKLIYIICEHCNAKITKCKVCNKIFERKTRTSRERYCKDCIVSKDELYKEYVEENKSITELSKKYNQDKIFLIRLIKKYGIEKKKDRKRIKKLKKKKTVCLKCKNEIKRSAKFLKYLICDDCIISFDDLYNDFVKNPKTFEEISKIHKLPYSVIREIIIEYNLIELYELNKEEEIEDIDFVRCCICKNKNQTLSRHLKKKHKINACDYKELYNKPTECRTLKIKRNIKASNSVKKTYENGVYDHLTWLHDINKIESVVNNLFDEIIFVGGSKKGFKRLWLRTSRLRNPDFVIIKDKNYLNELKKIKNWYKIQDKVSKDFINGILKINKIVEVNGFYWHSLRFNGRTKKEYEKDMINDYKKIGIECLVIWDYEVLENLDEVKVKINHYIENNK